MSNNEEEILDMLDPVIGDLLQAETQFPEATTKMQSRVWAGMATTIPLLPPLDIVGDAVISGVANTATTGTSMAAGAASAAGTIATGKAVGIAAALFVLGGMSGAYVHHAVTGEPEPIRIEVPVEVIREVKVEVPVPIETTIDDELTSAKYPRKITSPKSAVTKVAAPKDVNKRPTQNTVAAERTLIDVIRAAVARGKNKDALAAIARHQKEYPDGSLREEREGLRIIALARSGKKELAEAKAKAFRKRYPKSLLMPAVNKSLN